MVVASIALFVALGGTSIAAVSFARNAGKVDGKDAVSYSATTSRAAGNLVATASSGPNKGRLNPKFLAGVPTNQTWGVPAEVSDNATGAPIPLASVPGLGTLTGTCADQTDRPGVEDPITTISFANQSGENINLARRLGNGDGAVQSLPNGVVAPITIGGSNTFEYHIQRGAVNALVSGVVRQDGRGTPTATCLLWGAVVVAGG